MPAREAHERGPQERHVHEMHNCELSHRSFYVALHWTHFSFRIGGGKIIALLAVKSVDAGALRHTSDHLGPPEGTPVYPRVIPAGDEHQQQQLLLNIVAPEVPRSPRASSNQMRKNLGRQLSGNGSNMIKISQYTSAKHLRAVRRAKGDPTRY
jgi:hypothetical protein